MEGCPPWTQHSRDMVNGRLYTVDVLEHGPRNQEIYLGICER